MKNTIDYSHIYSNFGKYKIKCLKFHMYIIRAIQKYWYLSDYFEKLPYPLCSDSRWNEYLSLCPHHYHPKVLFLLEHSEAIKIIPINKKLFLEFEPLDRYGKKHIDRKVINYFDDRKINIEKIMHSFFTVEKKIENYNILPNDKEK